DGGAKRGAREGLVRLAVRQVHDEPVERIRTDRDAAKRRGRVAVVAAVEPVEEPERGRVEGERLPSVVPRLRRCVVLRAGGGRDEQRENERGRGENLHGVDVATLMPASRARKGAICVALERTVLRVRRAGPTQRLSPMKRARRRD